MLLGLLFSLLKHSWKVSGHTGDTGPAGASHFYSPGVSSPADVSSLRQRPASADVCVCDAQIRRCA